MSSRNAPPHKQLLRTEPHYFPHIIQSDFSFLFLEGVHTTFTERWLLQSQLWFYLCPTCELENKNLWRENKQSTRAVLSQSNSIQNWWDKQQKASRANVTHNKLLGSFDKLLIENFIRLFLFEPIPLRIYSFTCKQTQWVHPARENSS